MKPNYKLRSLLTLTASAALLTSQAQAATFYPAATGDWNAGATWLGGAVPPLTTDDVRLGDGRTVSVVIGDAITIAAVQVGHNSSTLKGSGILTLSGGALTITNDLTLAGGRSTQAGTVNIQGGHLTIGGNVVTTTLNNPIKTINLSSGTLEFTGTGTINNQASYTFFNFSGGTLKNAGTVNPLVTLTNTGTVQTDANKTTTMAGVISSTGALVKTGDGTLTLSNTNTYNGDTTVSAGTLYVSGALSNSAVTVGANGTIGRNNNIAANGGLGNGLTIEAGGNLDLTGAALAASSTSILGLTSGTLTLGNLTFQDLVGWDWLNASAGTYELVEGGFSGGADFGSTVFLSEGTAYEFNGKEGYFTADGGSLYAVIIPEPRAALLGGLGMLALLRRRRN